VVSRRAGIEVAAEHGVLAERAAEKFPLLGILAIGDVLPAGDGGFVELLGLDAAEDGKTLGWPDSHKIFDRGGRALFLFRRDSPEERSGVR